MRRLALLLLAVLSAAVGGCYHIDVKTPGVLDMRSDGAGLATVDGPTVRPRDGFDAFVSGPGVTTSKGSVVVEDRQHFAIALVPVSNDNAVTELQMCTEKVALRDVMIGDSRTSGDVLWIAVGMAASTVTFGIANIVMNTFMAPWTVTFSGTPVESPNGGAQ